MDLSMDFSDSASSHDRVLLVEGKKFYVDSSHLSKFSEFFEAHFKEKNEKESELKDVFSRDFENFLRILYPMQGKITRKNVCGLLVLSDRFKCEFVWQKCADFLEDSKNSVLLKQLKNWTKLMSSDSFKAKITERLEYILVDSETKEDILIILRTLKKFPFLALEGMAECSLFKLFLDETNKTTVVDEYLAIANKYGLESLKDNIAEFFIGVSAESSPIEQLELFYLADCYDMHKLTTSVFVDLVHSFFQCSAVDLIMSKKRRKIFFHYLYDAGRIGYKYEMDIFLVYFFENTNRSSRLLEFLLEASVIHSLDNLKTCMEQNLQKRKLEELKEKVDVKLSRKFAGWLKFESIESVLMHNLIGTKTSMSRFLEFGSLKALKKRTELFGQIRTSRDVAEFVFEGLSRNQKKNLLLNYFF